MPVGRLLVWMSGLMLLGIVTACGSSATPASAPTPAAGNPTATGVAASGVVPAGQGTAASTVLPVSTALITITPVLTTASPITTTAQITATATVTPTPSVTPTLGPPTATSTPAPSQATLAAAEKLDQALVSFAQAAATGNSAQTLQSQRQLLAVANDAQTAASADQSPYGQQLRSALGAVSDAATGNYDKMQAAHQDLGQIIGGAETPSAGLPRPATPPQQNLNDVSHQLQQAVDEYSKALSNGNQNDLLTAQRDLLNAVATADAATKNNQSPQAQQIQQALTAVHDGLAGDTNKFAIADTTLGATASQNGSAVTPTPTPRAVDLQPLQNDVDNKLQALQNALNTVSQATPNALNGNQSPVKQAQDDLRQSIQKANDTLANDNSPTASNFRNALGTARSVSEGDFTKLQAARDQLKAAVRQ
ncbi:MAG TPA: hypothetical protein VKX96_04860 [Chloroflexota bacterium]|nr:hypothetical protein [Chloroflexota bacterium]